MSSPLFREEVIQARQGQYLGAIRLARNPSFALVAWIAVTLVGALVAFAAWGQVTRKATVPGVLVPKLGTLEVSVPVAGVLAETRVSEGQHVEAGQVLFVLNTDRGTTQGATAALVAETLQQRLAALDAERTARELQVRQRRDALQDRLRRLEVERESAVQEAELAQRRAVLAQRNLERLQQLAREGFVSEAQVSVKQDEWIDLQARAGSARRFAAIQQREQHSLHAEIVETDSRWAADRAQLERGAIALRQEAIENDARRAVAVMAPSEGVVTTIYRPQGAALQPGQAVAAVVPQDSSNAGQETLEAQLFAPSRAAGLVRPGQDVLLRVTAFPYQKFGVAAGIVMSVGRTPIGPKDLPEGQTQALLQATGSQEPLYRIAVKLRSQGTYVYGEWVSFRPGMALEASVLLDRRALWEWVLAPFVGKGMSA